MGRTSENGSVAAGRGAQSALEMGTLDSAIQACPTNPWVTEHTKWFRARPDGTLQYARYQPKKYSKRDSYPDRLSRAGGGRGNWARGMERRWPRGSGFSGSGQTGVKILVRVDNPATQQGNVRSSGVADQAGSKAEHPGTCVLGRVH